MRHEIWTEPISGLWTSRAWTKADVELQDCSVRTVTLRLTQQFVVELQIEDSQGRNWLVTFLGVDKFRATTLAEHAADRPEAAAGQIGSSFRDGDQFQLDHIDGSISFIANSSTVRPGPT